MGVCNESCGVGLTEVYLVGYCFYFISRGFLGGDGLKKPKASPYLSISMRCVDIHWLCYSGLLEFEKRVLVHRDF